MAVEQSIKAVLIALGVDFPHEHDVTGVFVGLTKRMDIPEWFKKLVPELSRYMTELAELRGLAGYGYEKGLDASYFKDYSTEALRNAETTLSSCRRLLMDLFRNHLR
jgi:HEPN domain-containing protein